jgi:hypothetical protein
MEIHVVPSTWLISTKSSAPSEHGLSAGPGPSTLNAIKMHKIKNKSK